MATWEAPWPPPTICAEYEKIIPGFTSNLMTEIAKETAHRRQRETTGQWMAFLIAVGFLLVSGGLIGTGHDAAGTVLGTLDLVGLVSVFLYRNRALSSLQSKPKVLAPPDQSRS